MIAGVDVSRYQGADINWPLVKSAGNRFCFLKASEGVGYKDRTFDHNLVAARDAGLLVGAYHFARVSKGPSTIENDATAEAEWFLEVTEKTRTEGPRCLPPVLDIEWDKRAKGITPAEIVEWTTTFLAHVVRMTEQIPIVYTGRNFWRWKLRRTIALQGYPLWLVQYGKGEAPKKQIKGWPALFWQHSHTKPVRGIHSKGVDENWFFGDEKQLQAMADASTRASPGVISEEDTPMIWPDLASWICSTVRGVPRRGNGTATA